MQPSRLHLGLLCCTALGASACSWSRFDEVTDISPIVLLERPGSMKNGFGNSLATATNADHTEVLVGGGVGLSGAALFDLGNSDTPGTTSIDSGYCTGGTPACFLSSSLAGFATAQGPDMSRSLCFAVGSSSVNDKPGVAMRCKDSSEYTLEMPADAVKLLNFALVNAQPYDFPLTTDRSDEPVLLVTSPQLHTSWFYPSGSLHFSSLSAPSKNLVTDDSFGKSLAVLSMGKARVFAIGVSGKSEVLLWKSDGTTSSYIGCLGGTPNFGRAITGGAVNGDADDDLVVSDSTNVYAIDGKALAALPETDSTDCSFASLPAGALLGSFGCGSSSSLSGCAASNFGAAIAVGDLDNDGDGEVIVGAPNMTVRGEDNAGAILVFDADDPADSSFIDAKFLSSAEAGDNIGAAIVTPHVDGRDIIAAGAPGNGKAALFYCSPLLAPGAGGSRCP